MLSESALSVLDGHSKYSIENADCLDFMKSLPEDSVDFIFGSPPYEDRRQYGIDFRLKGLDWVDWMLSLCREMPRICKGMCALVVGHGKMSDYRWSGTPILLMAKMIEEGFVLRTPKIYHRIGISGSGGKDDFRADYEFIICFTKNASRLPWSNNVAVGHPPKYGPGGEFSHRLPGGQRRNQWGGAATGIRCRKENGEMVKKKRPSHKIAKMRDINKGIVLANPGNVFHCKVGGVHMGHPLSHQNEAPFPLSLAEGFVLSFCPPQGIVYDPFCGSGTTAHAAVENKRRVLTTDIRADQVSLAQRRTESVTPRLIVEADERMKAGAHDDEEEGEEVGETDCLFTS